MELRRRFTQAQSTSICDAVLKERMQRQASWPRHSSGSSLVSPLVHLRASATPTSASATNTPPLSPHARLALRIEQELAVLQAHAQTLQRQQRRRPRPAELLRSVGHAFLRHRRAQRDLQHIKLATDLAARRRSLAILTELRATLKQTEPSRLLPLPPTVPAPDHDMDNDSAWSLDLELEAEIESEIESERRRRRRQQEQTTPEHEIEIETEPETEMGIDSSRQTEMEMEMPTDHPTEPHLADRLLAQDALRGVLTLQSRWLQKALELARDRHVHAGFSHMALVPFLRGFLDPNGEPVVPSALTDEPTRALARFERIVRRQHLLPAHVQRAFDQLCRESMSDADSPATRVWRERDACDVMHALVDELASVIAEQAHLDRKPRPKSAPMSVTSTDIDANMDAATATDTEIDPDAALTADATRHPLYRVLVVFVEQMVFGRLAAVCSRAVTAQLDATNTQWRERQRVTRALDLLQLGLRVSPAATPALLRATLFQHTIRAFQRLPRLVPSSMLAALLEAVRVLHAEAQRSLVLPPHKLSPDVLLPVLVFVLCRCDLPAFPTQLFLMEQFVPDDGSESAYYLTCVRVAALFILSPSSEGLTGEGTGMEETSTRSAADDSTNDSFSASNRGRMALAESPLFSQTI